MKRKIIGMMFVFFMVIFSLNVIAYDRLRLRGGNGDIVSLYDLDEIEMSRIKVYSYFRIKEDKCYGYLVLNLKAKDINGKRIDLRLRLKSRGEECDFDGSIFNLNYDADIVYKTRNNGERSILGTDSSGYYIYGRSGVESVERFELEEEINVAVNLDEGLMNIYNEEFNIENIEI